MSTAEPAGEGGGGGGESTPGGDHTAGTPVAGTGIQSGVQTGSQHPPPSPLSGCYLLVVLPEPHTAQHKDLILNRLAKGFLSWDKDSCHVDLEKELQALVTQAPEGEEARNGERLIQYATENLVTEVLIHPQTNTLLQCIRNLLASFTKHRHIIHAGYTFSGNGSWILQDGTFSLADFLDAFSEHEVQRVLRAYENSVTVDIHCAGVGDWTTLRLSKETCTRSCRVRVNPDDVLTAGVPAIASFINYVGQYLIAQTLDQLMEPSDVVGNIRFSHPTLYVFPGGQGDAALFGINGFNMLVDGGFARKACFWDFARHLDRLDAVLLTRVNNSNIGGMSSVLRKKQEMHVYPQIGHFFCNLVERRQANSPDGDKDVDPLILNLTDLGQEMMVNLRHINLRAHPCYRDLDPINLYHKVGHGTLDMYVLSPSKDSREVREFLTKWQASDSKLFAGSHKKDSNNLTFPIQNLVSICALLVWQPANPDDTITRILFPGSTPQNKIFEGLERLKHLDFMKHPVCSAKSLSPSTSLAALKEKANKQKTSIIEKSVEKEKDRERDIKRISDYRKEKKDTLEPKTVRGVEEPTSKQAVPSAPIIPTKQPAKVDVKAKAKVLENKKIEKEISKTEIKKTEKDSKEGYLKKETMKKEVSKIDKQEGETKKTDVVKTETEKTVITKESKQKPEPKRKEIKETRTVLKTKIDATAKQAAKPAEKKLKPSIDKKDVKSSPTTPKKILNGTANKTEISRTSTKLVTKTTSKTVSTTPAKSAKDANNRKVVESKNITLSSAPAATAAKAPSVIAKPKSTERKPISRRPKTGSPSKQRLSGSPAKSTRSTPTASVKSEKDGIIRRPKTDKGTTDSSAVSTPSAIEPESAVKLVDKSLTEKSDDISIDSIESKVLADLKEEREVVEEIEAVLSKAERNEIALKEDQLEGDDEITAEATDKKEEDVTEEDVTAEIEDAPKKIDSRKESQEFTEEDEYLIVEKEEIYNEDSVLSCEGETKHLLDEVESEKVKKYEIPKDLDVPEEEEPKEKDESEEKEKDEQPEKKLQFHDENKKSAALSPIRKELEEEVKDIIASATDMVQKTEERDDSGKKDSEDMTKEPSSESPDKFDSSEKKTTDTDLKPEADQKEQVPEKLEESQDRISTLESGATTTAPTLPEDERIPLDEIKEDVDEKYVREEVKEKEIQLVKEKLPEIPPPAPGTTIKTFVIRETIPAVQRDIVKTPDEVADLPVHEEVDPKLYDMNEFDKVKEEKIPQTPEAKEPPTPPVKEQKGMFSFFGKVADKFEKGMDKLTGKSKKDADKESEEKSSKSSSPKEAKPQEKNVLEEVDMGKVFPKVGKIESKDTFEEAKPQSPVDIKVAAIKETAAFLQQEIKETKIDTVYSLEPEVPAVKESAEVLLGAKKPVKDIDVSKDTASKIFATVDSVGEKQIDLLATKSEIVSDDLVEDTKEVEALLEEASKKFVTVKDSLRDSLESLEDKIGEEIIDETQPMVTKDPIKSTLTGVAEKLEGIKPQEDDITADSKEPDKVKFEIPKDTEDGEDGSEEYEGPIRDLKEAVRDVGEVLAGTAGIVIDDKPKDVIEIVKKVAEVLKEDNFLSEKVLFDQTSPKNEIAAKPKDEQPLETVDSKPIVEEIIIPKKVGVTEELPPQEEIEEMLEGGITRSLPTYEKAGGIEVQEDPCIKVIKDPKLHVISPTQEQTPLGKDVKDMCSEMLEDRKVSSPKESPVVPDEYKGKIDVMEAGIEEVCTKKEAKRQWTEEDQEELEYLETDQKLDQPEILFEQKLLPAQAELVMVTPDSAPTSPKFTTDKVYDKELEDAVTDVSEISGVPKEIKEFINTKADVYDVIDEVIKRGRKITIEIIEYIVIVKKISREQVIYIIEEIIINKGIPPDSVVENVEILKSQDSDNDLIISSVKRVEIEEYIIAEYINKGKKITVQTIEEIAIKKVVPKRVIIEIIEEIIVKRKISREVVYEIIEEDFIKQVKPIYDENERRLAHATPETIDDKVEEVIEDKKPELTDGKLSPKSEVTLEKVQEISSKDHLKSTEIKEPRVAEPLKEKVAAVFDEKDLDEGKLIDDFVNIPSKDAVLSFLHEERRLSDEEHSSAVLKSDYKLGITDDIVKDSGDDFEAVEQEYKVQDVPTTTATTFHDIIEPKGKGDVVEVVEDDLDDVIEADEKFVEETKEKPEDLKEAPITDAVAKEPQTDLSSTELKTQTVPDVKNDKVPSEPADTVPIFDKSKPDEVSEGADEDSTSVAASVIASDISIGTEKYLDEAKEKTTDLTKPTKVSKDIFDEINDIVEDTVAQVSDKIHDIKDTVSKLDGAESKTEDTVADIETKDSSKGTAIVDESLKQDKPHEIEIVTKSPDDDKNDQIEDKIHESTKKIEEDEQITVQEVKKEKIDIDKKEEKENIEAPEKIVPIVAEKIDQPTAVSEQKDRKTPELVEIEKSKSPEHAKYETPDDIAKEVSDLKGETDEIKRKDSVLDVTDIKVVDSSEIVQLKQYVPEVDRKDQPVEEVLNGHDEIVDKLTTDKELHHTIRKKRSLVEDMLEQKTSEPANIDLKPVESLKKPFDSIPNEDKEIEELEDGPQKELPKTEDDEDDKESGTVRRMVVTASSEDGGDETELCPTGSITFVKSITPEDSLKDISTKSTPDKDSLQLEKDSLYSGKSTPEKDSISERSVSEFKDDKVTPEDSLEKPITGIQSHVLHDGDRRKSQEVSKPISPVTIEDKTPKAPEVLQQADDEKISSPTEEISEKATEKIPEKVKENILEKTADKVPEVLKEDVLEPVEKILDKVTEDVPAKLTDKIPKEFKEDIPEKSSYKIPEKLIEAVSEKAIEEVPEKPMEKTPEQPTDKVPEIPKEGVTDKPTEETPKEITEEVPEEKEAISAKSMEKLPVEQKEEVIKTLLDKDQETLKDEVSEKPTEKSPIQETLEKSEQKIAEQPTKPVLSVEISDKPEEKILEKPIPQIPEKLEEEAPEKTTELILQKPSEKIPEQKPLQETKEQSYEGLEEKLPVKPKDEMSAISTEKIPEPLTEKVPEKSMIEVLEKSIEKSSDKISEKPAKETPVEPIEKILEQPKLEISDKSKEVPEKPPVQLPEEPKKEIPEKLTEPISTEPKEKISEQLKTEVSDISTEKLSELSPKTILEKPKDQLPGKPEDEISEQTAEKVTDDLKGESPEKPVEKILEKLEDEVREEPMEITLEKLTTGVPEKSLEKISASSTETVVEKFKEESPEKLTNKLPEKLKEEVIEQPTEKIPEKPKEDVTKPTEQFSGEPTEGIIEDLTKTISEQLKEEVLEKVPKKITAEISDESTDKVPESLKEEIPEKQTEKIIVSEKPMDIPGLKSPEKIQSEEVSPAETIFGKSPTEKYPDSVKKDSIDSKFSSLGSSSEKLDLSIPDDKLTDKPRAPSIPTEIIDEKFDASRTPSIISEKLDKVETLDDKVLKDKVSPPTEKPSTVLEQLDDKVSPVETVTDKLADEPKSQSIIPHDLEVKDLPDNKGQKDKSPSPVITEQTKTSEAPAITPQKLGDENLRVDKLEKDKSPSPTTDKFTDVPKSPSTASKTSEKEDIPFDELPKEQYSSPILDKKTDESLPSHIISKELDLKDISPIKVEKDRSLSPVKDDVTDKSRSSSIASEKLDEKDKLKDELLKTRSPSPLTDKENKESDSITPVKLDKTDVLEDKVLKAKSPSPSTELEPQIPEKLDAYLPDEKTHKDRTPSPAESDKGDVKSRTPSISSVELDKKDAADKDLKDRSPSPMSDKSMHRSRTSSITSEKTDKKEILETQELEERLLPSTTDERQDESRRPSTTLEKPSEQVLPDEKVHKEKSPSPTTDKVTDEIRKTSSTPEKLHEKDISDVKEGKDAEISRKSSIASVKLDEKDVSEQTTDKEDEKYGQPSIMSVKLDTKDIPNDKKSKDNSPSPTLITERKDSHEPTITLERPVDKDITHDEIQKDKSPSPKDDKVNTESPKPSILSAKPDDKDDKEQKDEFLSTGRVEVIDQPEEPIITPKKLAEQDILEQELHEESLPPATDKDTEVSRKPSITSEKLDAKDIPDDKMHKERSPSPLTNETSEKSRSPSISSEKPDGKEILESKFQKDKSPSPIDKHSRTPSISSVKLDDKEISEVKLQKDRPSSPATDITDKSRSPSITPEKPDEQTISESKIQKDKTPSPETDHHSRTTGIGSEKINEQDISDDKLTKDKSPSPTVQSISPDQLDEKDVLAHKLPKSPPPTPEEETDELEPSDTAIEKTEKSDTPDLELYKHRSPSPPLDITTDKLEKKILDSHVAQDKSPADKVSDKSRSPSISSEKSETAVISTDKLTKDHSPSSSDDDKKMQPEEPSVVSDRPSEKSRSPNIVSEKLDDEVSEKEKSSSQTPDEVTEKSREPSISDDKPEKKGLPEEPSPEGKKLQDKPEVSEIPDKKIDAADIPDDKSIKERSPSPRSDISDQTRSPSISSEKTEEKDTPQIEVPMGSKPDDKIDTAEKSKSPVPSPSPDKLTEMLTKLPSSSEDKSKIADSSATQVFEDDKLETTSVPSSTTSDKLHDAISEDLTKERSINSSSPDSTGTTPSAEKSQKLDLKTIESDHKSKSAVELHEKPDEKEIKSSPSIDALPVKSRSPSIVSEKSKSPISKFEKDVILEGQKSSVPAHEIDEKEKVAPVPVEGSGSEERKSPEDESDKFEKKDTAESKSPRDRSPSYDRTPKDRSRSHSLFDSGEKTPLGRSRAASLFDDKLDEKIALLELDDHSIRPSISEEIEEDKLSQKDEESKPTPKSPSLSDHASPQRVTDLPAEKRLEIEQYIIDEFIFKNKKINNKIIEEIVMKKSVSRYIIIEIIEEIIIKRKIPRESVIDISEINKLKEEDIEPEHEKTLPGITGIHDDKSPESVPLCKKPEKVDSRDVKDKTPEQSLLDSKRPSVVGDTVAAHEVPDEKKASQSISDKISDLKPSDLIKSDVIDDETIELKPHVIEKSSIDNNEKPEPEIVEKHLTPEENEPEKTVTTKADNPKLEEAGTKRLSIVDCEHLQSFEDETEKRLSIPDDKLSGVDLPKQTIGHKKEPEAVDDLASELDSKKPEDQAKPDTKLVPTVVEDTESKRLEEEVVTITEAKRTEIEEYITEEYITKGKKITREIIEDIVIKKAVPRYIILEIIEEIIIKRKISRVLIIDFVDEENTDREDLEPADRSTASSISEKDDNKLRKSPEDKCEIVTGKSTPEISSAKDQTIDFSGKSTPDLKSSLLSEKFSDKSGYSTPDMRQFDERSGKSTPDYRTEYESQFHKAFVGGMTEIRTTHITTYSGKSTPDFSAGREDTPEPKSELQSKPKDAPSEKLDDVHAVKSDVVVHDKEPVPMTVESVEGVPSSKVPEEPSDLKTTESKTLSPKTTSDQSSFITTISEMTKATSELMTKISDSTTSSVSMVTSKITTSQPESKVITDVHIPEDTSPSSIITIVKKTELETEPEAITKIIKHDEEIDELPGTGVTTKTVKHVTEIEKDESEIITKVTKRESISPEDETTFSSTTTTVTKTIEVESEPEIITEVIRREIETQEPSETEVITKTIRHVTEIEESEPEIITRVIKREVVESTDETTSSAASTEVVKASEIELEPSEKEIVTRTIKHVTEIEDSEPEIITKTVRREVEMHEPSETEVITRTIRHVTEIEDSEPEVSTKTVRREVEMHEPSETEVITRTIRHVTEIEETEPEIITKIIKREIYVPGDEDDSVTTETSKVTEQDDSDHYDSPKEMDETSEIGTKTVKSSEAPPEVVKRIISREGTPEVTETITTRTTRTIISEASPSTETVTKMTTTTISSDIEKPELITRIISREGKPEISETIKRTTKTISSDAGPEYITKIINREGTPEILKTSEVKRIVTTVRTVTGPDGESITTKDVKESSDKMDAEDLLEKLIDSSITDKTSKSTSDVKSSEERFVSETPEGLKTEEIIKRTVTTVTSTSGTSSPDVKTFIDSGKSTPDRTSDEKTELSSKEQVSDKPDKSILEMKDKSAGEIPSSLVKDIVSEEKSYSGKSSPDVLTPKDVVSIESTGKSTPDISASPLIRDSASIPGRILSGRSTPDRKSRTATPEGFRSGEVIRTVITTTRTMSDEGDIITVTKEVTESTNEEGETVILEEKTNVKRDDKLPTRDTAETAISSVIGSIKASELKRGYSPGSDVLSEKDFGPSSPRSDISSGHSRAATHVWGSSEERHTYSDDEQPSSPLSASSQFGYSPQQPRYELPFDKDAHKHGGIPSSTMTGSFCGELPTDPVTTSATKPSYTSATFTTSKNSEPIPIQGEHSMKRFKVEREFAGGYEYRMESKKYVDDADLDFDRAMMEHREKRGEDLAPHHQSNGASAMVYTNGTSTDKDATTPTLEKKASKKKSDPMVASFSAEKEENAGQSGKDPLEGWGKPLYLPSPKPPRKFNLQRPVASASTEELNPENLNFDVISNWGEPLRLPSPAPVPTNDIANNGTPGTPKKERKQTKKVISENNKNKKRSESPNKIDKKTKDSKNKVQPVYMDLTYVPHHGNSYYSSLEFFKRIRARYYVFSGTEPSREVYDALLEAKKTWEDKNLEVTMIPTYDTDTLGYWVADNEEALAANHIDLSPSASRCTINLQDHETSCSAYRLEF